jgi:hypothetical protein
MNHQPANPDARVDYVLHALRTTEPPAGMEARIAARIAQATEARTQSAPPGRSSFLNAAKAPGTFLIPSNLYLAAGTALTLLLALSLFRHHSAPTSATLNFNITPQTQPTSPNLEAPSAPSRRNSPTHAITLAAEWIPTPHPASSQNPDQIALAETLAPSHPAPLQPLTPQEHLIRAATRPGQPIELAELDLARAPLLQALADARQSARIHRYVEAALTPFALADALASTPDLPAQEAATPPPPPPPSTSSSN